MCSILNMDDDIVAKGGANSVYGFGLKKERLGVSFKFVDGTEYLWPIVILTILEGLGVLSDDTRSRLMKMNPYDVINDNGEHVGTNECMFEVRI